MANASIFAAFERFWLHITAALGNKADIAHTHTVANISDLTATAAELNYCDGVTSNIQTQLNNKAPSSHTHTYVDQINANGNILALKDDSAAGLSPFTTNSSTTNLPTFGSFVYSSGYVSKRVSDQANIVLFDYRKGTPAVNTFLTDTWSGWRDLSCEKLYNKYTTRPTSANIASTDDRKGTVEFFHCTSSMKTGAPPFEGHILHMNWDNTGGWDAQLCVRNSTAGLAVRGSSNGTWGDWATMATQDYVREQIASISTSTAAGCVSEFDSGVISYAAGSTYYNSKDSKSKFYLVTAKHSSYGSHSWVIDFNYLKTSNQYFRVQVGASGSSPVWITIQVKKDSSNRLVVGIAPDCTNVTLTQVCGFY